MKKKCQITITHANNTKKYELRWGLRLDALNASCETPLEFSCRKADCGICIFSILKGEKNLSPMTPKEKKYLEAMRSYPNERLACQCRLQGDIDIEVESYE